MFPPHPGGDLSATQDGLFSPAGNWECENTFSGFWEEPRLDPMTTGPLGWWCQLIKVLEMCPWAKGSPCLRKLIGTVSLSVSVRNLGVPGIW